MASKRNPAAQTDVEYYDSYDVARRAAFRRPGLHCFRPKGTKWIQCFLHLHQGACQELAMTVDGEVEEGVTWTLDEEGQMRVNPHDDDEYDEWDGKTPVEEVSLPPLSAWPRVDASDREWAEFRRKYPLVPHSGRRSVG